MRHHLSAGLLATLVFAAAALTLAAPKQVLLMNRLGPSQLTLYTANADGSSERPLFAASGFDYNASFSADGQWIVFTSERTGSGQADLYRVHPDGSGLERLTDDPDLDDQAAVSPDGSQIAFGRVVLGHFQIFVMNADGSSPRRLTELSAVAFNAFASWGPAPQLMECLDC